MDQSLGYPLEEIIMGFSVESDLSRRLLSVCYTQHVGQEEARCCFERVQLLMADLQPGFRLLTDLTRLKSMDTACSFYMKQIMDICDEYEVALVVRVVPDPHKDIGYNIMSLFHYTLEVQIVNCSNLDEATRALAN